MSRLRHFTRSVISGYLLIGANTFYVFISVPLALGYLSAEEFDRAVRPDAMVNPG